MVSTKKIIAALGVVAGLGIVALPISSYAATEQNITVSATIGSTIAIATPTPASVSLNPVNNGVVSEGSSTVNVSTNNAGGYTLSIKDSDSNTGLVHATNSTLSLPAGVPTQGTSAWGYKGGDVSSYAAITTSNVTLKTTSAPTSVSGDDVAITFGATASASQAAGTYNGGVTLTVAAN